MSGKLDMIQPRLIRSLWMYFISGMQDRCSADPAIRCEVKSAMSGSRSWEIGDQSRRQMGVRDAVHHWEEVGRDVFT